MNKIKKNKAFLSPKKKNNLQRIDTDSHLPTVIPNDGLLEFRLDGKGISPNTFSAKEVGELFINLEESLRQYIIINNKNIKKEEILLSPVQINNKCLSIKFSPNIKEIITVAFIAISTGISTNNLSGLPLKTIEPLREIQKIIRIKNCTGSFYQNGINLAKIDTNTNIFFPDTGLIQGETIIYATVRNVGGKQPTVKVELDSEDTLTLNINKETAKILAKRLYEQIGFRGTAKWSKSNNELIDFKITGLIESYEPTSVKEGFNELKTVLGKYWDKVDNVNDTLFRS